MTGRGIAYDPPREYAHDQARWADRGLCHQTDPEAFHPDTGGSSTAAKRVCAICPVRTECLTYALANDERWGIWGGLTERERRKLKRTSKPKGPTP